MGYAAKLGGSSNLRMPDLYINFQTGVGSYARFQCTNTVTCAGIPKLYKYLKSQNSYGADIYTYVDGVYVGGNVTNYDISQSQGTYNFQKNSSQGAYGSRTEVWFYNTPK